MLEVLSLAIAFVALCMSGFLAWLRLQEWRAKPDLRLDMDWIIGGGGPTTLRIVAENRGTARGGVRNVVLSPSDRHDATTSFAFLRHVSSASASPCCWAGCCWHCLRS